MRLLLVVLCTGCTAEPDTITIDPPTASIEIVNGAIATPIFHATRAVTWSASDPRIGVIGDDGTYTPTGELGGIVTITATAGDVQATATLTVKLHLIDPGGIDPARRDALRAAADALVEQAPSQDPAIAWSYPYDETVFPRGLPPPPLMWNGGAVGDWLFVHYRSATFELETFAQIIQAIDGETLPTRHVLGDHRWWQLTESTAGRIDLAVARATATATTGVIHHHWTIAPAALPGTIYYWTQENAAKQLVGRIQSLTPGTPAVDALGDYRPGGNEGCPKCHTPSADGRHLALVMSDPTRWPAVESIDYDLRDGTTAFAGYPALGGWGDAALSPHGEVVVPSFAPIRGTLGLAALSGAYDPTTGASIADTGLEAVRAWMPVFSPDGSLLVYVDETPGCSYGTGVGADAARLKACSGDLHAFDWDPSARRATNGRVLVAKGGDASRDVMQFPTLSPDHATVVYQRGPELGSLSHVDDTLIHGGLDAASTATGDEVVLARLAGSGYPFAAGDRDRGLDYDPSLAPVTAGGYQWVVFVSRRTYGNVLTGPAFVSERLGGTKQLWVAALDPDAPPGSDPSHPAFWLPGQDMSPTDLHVINQRPRWTLSP